MSGQSDTGTNLLPDPYGFVRIRFQISRFLLSFFFLFFFGGGGEEYANFMHRQGATDYKARG